MTLSHSPADVVRRLLVSLGLGTLPTAASVGEWPIYATSEPSTPDNVITVIDTAGVTHGRDQVNGETQEHFGILIRIRCARPDDGYLKADLIRTSIDTVWNNGVSIGVDQYTVHAITRSTAIIPLGKGPTDKRNLFTINAVVALT